MPKQMNLRKDGIFRYKVYTLTYKDADKRLSQETRDMIEKEYSDQDIDVSREELFADEASAYYTEALLGDKVTVDMLLGKQPTLKQKILSFFAGGLKAYSDAFADEGNISPVQFEVKQFVDNQNRLYLAVALTKINETSVMDDTITESDRSSTRLLPVSEYSIADFINKINPSDEKLFKYIPDGEELVFSKENAEPTGSDILIENNEKGPDISSASNDSISQNAEMSTESEKKLCQSVSHFPKLR